MLGVPTTGNGNAHKNGKQELCSHRTDLPNTEKRNWLCDRRIDSLFVMMSSISPIEFVSVMSNPCRWRNVGTSCSLRRRWRNC